MSLSREDLYEHLKAVIDPEVGLNIVDMGLVYDVTEMDGSIHVQMTLTSRGCPMGSFMTAEVQDVLGALDGVKSVEVELVWSPQWSPAMIRPGALEELRNA